MKSRLRRIALATLVAASPIATASAAEPDAAVLAATAGFYKALNALFTGEVQPMEEVWSHQPDVTYMGPDGGLVVGWDAVQAEWAKQAALKLGGEIESKDLHVMGGKDIAFTSGLEVGHNIVDGKSVTVTIRATNLFRLEDGTWKMVGHHTDLLPFLEK
jgi:ketosteroid isomerase-like protein